MRKYVIIISTVAFITIAWLIIFLVNNSSNMHKNEWYIQNGLYFSYADNKLYNGHITQKALNKTMVTEINNGERTGWFKVFNEKKQLEMKGKLVKNVNQGKWTYYFPNGNIQSEGYFKNDVPVGKWVWYYENAKMKEICSFENGIRDGEYIHYNKLGKIVDKRFYVKGTPQQKQFNI